MRRMLDRGACRLGTRCLLSSRERVGVEGGGSRERGPDPAAQRSCAGTDATRATSARWAGRSTGLYVTFVVAGWRPRKFPCFQSCAGRTGRGTKPPPQLGQTPSSTCSTQSWQKVHSNEQMRASVEDGGSGLLQCSQVGRNSSMGASSGSGGTLSVQRSGHARIQCQYVTSLVRLAGTQPLIEACGGDVPLRRLPLHLPATRSLREVVQRLPQLLPDGAIAPAIAHEQTAHVQVARGGQGGEIQAGRRVG